MPKAGSESIGVAHFDVVMRIAELCIASTRNFGTSSYSPDQGGASGLKLYELLRLMHTGSSRARRASLSLKPMIWRSASCYQICGIEIVDAHGFARVARGFKCARHSIVHRVSGHARSLASEMEQTFSAGSQHGVRR